MNNIRLYNKRQVITFAKVHNLFGGLSNMSNDYTLFVNEVPIYSVEALYQACKFSLYPNIQRMIVAERNAMRAKQISRHYQTYVRQDWKKIQYQVMKWCLEVKLLQNWDTFGALLKSTGDSAIVEYSEKDIIWGASPIDNDSLRGINALGRLLMQVREEYVRPNRRPQCINPPQITGFLLFGTPISKVFNVDYYFEE